MNEVSEFRATIEIWPHSSGAGAEKDQKRCGPKQNTFTFKATNMREAVGIAELISNAIDINPAVWQSPIVRLERTAV